MAKKSPKPARKNRVRKYREELGWGKADLAKKAVLSEKTISRIEKEEAGFRETTYWKILRAINKGRKKDGDGKLEFTDLFDDLMDS